MFVLLSVMYHSVTITSVFTAKSEDQRRRRYDDGEGRQRLRQRDVNGKRYTM